LVLFLFLFCFWSLSLQIFVWYLANCFTIPRYRSSSNLTIFFPLSHGRWT
jgi:hypothetical protein